MSDTSLQMWSCVIVSWRTSVAQRNRLIPIGGSLFCPRFLQGLSSHLNGEQAGSRERPSSSFDSGPIPQDDIQRNCGRPVTSSLP
ncbi:hypothetical protein BRADI_4g06534v3 [Brachypodium distachyon]|uniref:Uncharacterized protein n=1 Tax=Brachypodium distachyon TaxID=15368 RepID=A0A2K2CKU5_BRADI|nr:hypothetical protein BRADI_4g06534v3 [Brachypodium distachyon]